MTLSLVRVAATHKTEMPLRVDSLTAPGSVGAHVGRLTGYGRLPASLLWWLCGGHRPCDALNSAASNADQPAS